MGVIGGIDPVVTDGLVLYVDPSNQPRFYTSGSSTLKDMSGLENDITLVNYPLYGKTSKPSTAYISSDNSNTRYLTFDQNGADNLGTVAQTEYGSYTGHRDSNFTYQLWVNTSESNASGDGRPLIGQGGGNIFSLVTLAAGKFTFRYFSGGWTNRSATTTINDGNWHNLILIYSAGTVDMYVDGNKEVDAGSGYWSNAARWQKLGHLGRNNNGGSITKSSIKFGPVKVYDRALSQAEVLQNYNALKDRFV